MRFINKAFTHFRDKERNRREADGIVMVGTLFNSYLDTKLAGLFFYCTD